MNTPRRIFALFVALLAATLLSAQSAGTGTLVGRVTDGATKLTLAGARVSVAGTTLTTFADQGGDYVLSNVPAGAQTVVFSYVGYSEFTKTVGVAASQTVALDGTFGSDVTTMEKFVIEGSVVGTARAINQQRSAATLTSIVAADEIGRFPDQNAAESMQRIPGVALYRDQGEGRFIVIRGLKPDLNSVSINGVSMASPERGDRTTALDVLPSDALGAIEVTKVPTPDMPADGIGGSVNVKTRSAFDSGVRQLSLSAQGQFSDLRDAYSSKFSGTFADLFNDGKVGFIIAPSWQERKFGSYNVETDGGWALTQVPGAAAGTREYFFNGIAFRNYEILRTRYGANTALEFKPDRESLYYIRGTYSRFTDAETRTLTFLPFVEGSAITQLDAKSATVTGVRRERHDIRLREKDQDVTSIVAGGERAFGDWKLDGHIAYSEGNEKRPDELTVRFRKSTRGSNYTYNFAEGTYNGIFTQTGGPSIADPANSGLFNEISRFRLVDSPGEETEWNYSFDARRDFTLEGGSPAYVKAGVRLREKVKTQAEEVFDHTVPASFTYTSVMELQPRYPYFGTSRASNTKVRAAYDGNRAAFVPTRLFVESETADWKSTEDVAALYGMGSATFGQLNLLAGARYERTEFENRGNELINGTTVRPVARSRDYDNFLPGVYLRYDLSKQTVLRASWSNALTRPAFGESALSRNVNTTVTPGRVTEGNPGLEPFEAMNWDASIEHYLPSLGILSAGVFYKDIKNFTYQRIIPGGDPSTGYELTTFVNGDKGHIAGLELAYQQQFRFLPAPFDGLGFLANYTMTDSEATYPSRPGETLDFIGQSEDIGNVGLSYERKGLFVRLALNFRSPRIREDEPLGVTAAEDFWVDDFKQLDVTASYKLSRNWEVFGEALNITDEPFRVYYGKKGTRFVQFEEYGWSANFGVRWKL